MQRGYIKIWRKLEDSGLLQMHSTLALFMHMLMKATYKPCRIGMVELERGQLVTGRIKLAEAIGVSDRQVRTCLDRLHDLQIVTSKATSHFTVYTIVNYNEYQDIDSLSDQQNDQPATNDRPTSDQPATTIQEANTLSIKNKPISEYSDGFIKFWDTWPASKRKGGKSECWKAWKAKKLESVCDEIINHVIYCKGNGIWKDPQFIEAPKVYINQAKWDGAETVDTKKPFDVNEFMKKANGL